MTRPRINLYSDTQSQPTPGMRQAIAEAPVGDEQSGDDPSVNKLCAQVAELSGKAAAVFLPSGTMCNEIAIRVHCEAGDEVIAHQSCHILNFEGGGPAALSGVQICPLPGERGIFSGAQVAAAVRPVNRYFPRSRLVVVEQTSNLAGGTVWPLAAIHEVASVARERGLLVHMDGARLVNAVVASGVSMREFAAPFDSVWIDLSKGLGCPVGAVLAGSEAFIENVWRWKQRFGGAMRQAGILAAAGSYALEHHIDRLANDHRNAKRLATALVEIPGITLDLDGVQSNIVFFDIAESRHSPAAVCEQLATRGIRIGAMGPTRLRAVTHLDVSAEHIEETIAALSQILTADA